MASENRRERNL